MGNKKKRNNSQQNTPVSGSGSLDTVLPAEGKRTTRMPCFCEASMHKLINNCINCGRIVCSVEGSGPCLTCGNPVLTNEEQLILSKNNKESRELSARLNLENITFKSIRNIILGSDQEKEKAVAHKNRLLEFNDTLAKRTTVIEDYDAVDPEANKWLSASQKEKLMKKQEQEYDLRHGRHKAPVVTFDFAGRNIIQETPTPSDAIDELLDDDISIYKSADYTPSDGIDYMPKYCAVAVPITVPYGSKKDAETAKRERIRIQDKELQFMADEGKCLSIGQPYASLIIAGIKTCEGRSWSTMYRGVLWIHASMANPSHEEISSIEALYRHNTGAVKFPESYPRGVLLGCVQLTECLTQEEYHERFPEGECGADYVFICENPREVRCYFPMKGGRKIYKMESKFHDAAKKLLI